MKNFEVYSSTVTKESVRFSETSLNLCRTTWSLIRESTYLHDLYVLPSIISHLDNEG
jgi:hypothetical protein